MSFEPVPRPADFDEPVEPAPVEPAVNEPNKALASFVAVLVGLGVQWAASKGFDIDQEGVTAVLAPLVGALVYWVSNQTKLF